MGGRSVVSEDDAGGCVVPGALRWYSTRLDECRDHPSPGTDEQPRLKAWD